MQQMKPLSTAYNMPQFLPHYGPLDRERIQQTFMELVARHEALRTSFTLVNGEPVQIIHTDLPPFSMEYIDSEELLGHPLERSDEPIFVKDQMASFVRPFELDKASLLKWDCFEFVTTII